MTLRLVDGGTTRFKDLGGVFQLRHRALRPPFGAGLGPDETRQDQDDSLAVPGVFFFSQPLQGIDARDLDGLALFFQQFRCFDEAVVALCFECRTGLGRVDACAARRIIEL